MGQTCGAVTGALMVIGLKYGRVKAEDVQARDKTYEIVKEFVKRFKSKNGSLICRELLRCDISTTQGMKTAEEKKLFDTLCPGLVQSASEILEQVL